jgi:large subunit ribosomal protein L10
MNREQKTAVVDEIAEQISSADAVFAVDYRGLSVSQAADLRVQLREADARLRIVKNSLTERAADKAGVAGLKDMLIGPTALTLVRGDAAIAAKTLADAARRLNLLEFKGGLLNGALLTSEDVRSISRLPARHVLHAQLVGTVASPLTGVVRGLNALIAGLAIQLQAMAEQGLVSGEAPAPQPAAESEAAAEPQPEAAAEPQAAAAAEPRAAAEPETEAAVQPTPAAGPEAAAKPETEAAVQPTPAAGPEAVAEPEPEAAAEAPEPEAESNPETDAAVESAPEPETPAEPAPEPPAEPEAEAAPEPEAEPQPEAAAEPESENPKQTETESPPDAPPAGE